MKVVWIILITLLLIGGIVGLIVYLMGKEGYKPINNNSKKYITFTNHLSKQLIPNKNTKFSYIAGLNHVKMCLNRLIKIGIKSNRIAILPPPWKCIRPHHNNGIEIPEYINWDFYFDVSDLVSKKIIAPLNIRVHKRDGSVYWNGKNVNYINNRLYSKYKKDNITDIYVITYYNDIIKPCDCHKNHIIKGYKDYLDKPSKNIKNIAKQIYIKMGVFNMIHIRSPYEPWANEKNCVNKEHLKKGLYKGVKFKKIIKSIQINNIIKILKQHNISKKSPLLVLYHFDGVHSPNKKLLEQYLSQLKLLPYNIIFEKDIIELHNSNNTILSYEILKELSYYSNKNICSVTNTMLKKCNIKLN